MKHNHLKTALVKIRKNQMASSTKKSPFELEIERVADQVCSDCYYNPRVVGQAFRAWNCQGCKVEAQHHNTGVPVYCMGCAKEKGLCRKCGGPLTIN